MGSPAASVTAGKKKNPIAALSADKEMGKKESEKKSKEMRELEEKKRKLECEAEERKKRELSEAEFKKRREEERLKRQEKKREESNRASFKKSELKNDLNKEEKLRIKMIAQELKGNDPCQFKLKKTGHTDGRDASASTSSNQSKPMFSTARNKNKDLLASLSDPGLPRPKRPSSTVRENQFLKKSTLQLKRSQHIEYGVHLQASSSLRMKEANVKEVYNTINEMGSANSNKIPVEKGMNMNELGYNQVKPQLDNGMQCEAVRVDDAVEDVKSNDRKSVEEIKSNDKKSSLSKFVGSVKKPNKSNRNKSKHENKVEDKNTKMPDVKKKANSDTEGDIK